MQSPGLSWRLNSGRGYERPLFTKTAFSRTLDGKIPTFKKRIRRNKMLKRLFVFSCVVFVFAVGASAVSAQNWVDLGTKEVKDRSEQDTWHVGKGKGDFR